MVMDSNWLSMGRTIWQGTPCKIKRVVIHSFTMWKFVWVWTMDVFTWKVSLSIVQSTAAILCWGNNMNHVSFDRGQGRGTNLYTYDINPGCIMFNDMGH